MLVPPFVGTNIGLTPVTVGAALLSLYVKPLASVPNSPLKFVTTTSTVPAACADVVAVIDVPAGLTVTLGAAPPPNVTVAPGPKPLPLMLTDVPPEVGPVAGETPVTRGCEAKVNASPREVTHPLGLLTLTVTGPFPAGV